MARDIAKAGTPRTIEKLVTAASGGTDFPYTFTFSFSNPTGGGDSIARTLSEVGTPRTIQEI